eukprot:3331582-Pleurochrysis_carterae.AAC.1
MGAGSGNGLGSRKGRRMRRNWRREGPRPPVHRYRGRGRRARFLPCESGGRACLRDWLPPVLPLSQEGPLRAQTTDRHASRARLVGHD